MQVYRITNKLNGKMYVGQTTETAAIRFKNHCCVKSGTISAIKSAIQKYGRDNFSLLVLSECTTIAQLNDAEIYWIEYYQSIAPNGYNFASGGNGGGKHSSVSRLKMSKARKGIQKPNKGSYPSIAIICNQNNKTYPSINKAAFDLKVQRSNIQKVLDGSRPHTGGYTFKRVV